MFVYIKSVTMKNFTATLKNYSNNGLSLGLLFILLNINYLNSQTNLLTEDFSSASGTTPPVTLGTSPWNNSTVFGNVNSDVWHFENTTNLSLDYPIIGKCAVFDAQNLSNDGIFESVSLISPFIDCSPASNIVLSFDHKLDLGINATGSIEVFDGTGWSTVQTFTSSTLETTSEIINLTSSLFNVTNAKFRFSWNGNGSGFWAIDNVKVLGPLSNDAGIVSISNPIMPFAFDDPNTNVMVTIKNYAINPLNSATIQWKVNGISQSPFNWNATNGLGYFQEETNINLGASSVPFLPGKKNVIEVWSEVPNNILDMDPKNDTLKITLIPRLCGSYTIGGANPDFDNFTDASMALNNAGISCPVNFIVRSGTYDEQVDISKISGNSISNFLTFSSETGNKADVILNYSASNSVYDYTVLLDSAFNVTFENMTIQRGANNFNVYSKNSDLINFTNCDLNYNNNFSNDSIVTILQSHGGNFTFENGEGLYINNNQSLENVSITNCKTVNIFENNYISYILINGSANDIFIEKDSIGRINIDVSNIDADNIVIDSNRIYNTDANYNAIFFRRMNGNGTNNSITQNIVYGQREIIYIENIDTVMNNRLSGGFRNNSVGISINGQGQFIANNTITLGGFGSSKGIYLNGSNNQLYFNTINNIGSNITQSLGIETNGALSGLKVKNNIFACTEGGIPMKLNNSLSIAASDWDYNCYYSKKRVVGKLGSVTYNSLNSWKTATNLGVANHSKKVNPYFNSQTNLTPNHIQLIGNATPIPGISTDIIGNARTAPDMGAIESEISSGNGSNNSASGNCADAGINFVVAPLSPLNPSNLNQDIVVQLQNHSEAIPLNDVLIYYTINDQATPSVYNWSGSLNPMDTINVTIENSHPFNDAFIYNIKVWTASANGGSECNFYNDTTLEEDIAVPLCGTYNIGGNDAHFKNFTAAATVLNNAGMTCPVTFLVKDSIYTEQFRIERITGNSLLDSITFIGITGNSNDVILQYNEENDFLDYTVFADSVFSLSFKNISILRNANSTNISVSKAENILFENCTLNNYNRFDYDSLVVIKHSTGGSYHVQNSTEIFIDSNNVNEIGITNSGNNIRIHNNTLVNINIDLPDNAADNIIIDSNTITCLNPNIWALAFKTANINSANNKVLANDIYGAKYIVYTEFIDSINNNKLNGGTYNNSIGLLLQGEGQFVANNFITVGSIGKSSAIVVNGINNSILHNSINNNGGNANSSFGIEINNSLSGLAIQNNIIACTDGGVPLFLYNSISNSDINNNCYYTPDSVIIVKNNSKYSSLIDWQNSSSFDFSSKNVNPFFTSDTDLSMNQAQLNGTALNNLGVNVDITGTLRGVNPDIGAKEYTPCVSDAGINRLIAPEEVISSTTLAQPIVVELQNQGSDILSAVEIHWSVNGVEQAPYNWTSSGLAAGMADTVEIGNFLFSGTNLFKFKFWTNLPNLNVDCNNYNDTTRVERLVTRLCGTYTVGGMNPDFENFTDLSVVINSAGISCPVTFNIWGETFNEQLKLDHIPGNVDNHFGITFQKDPNSTNLNPVELKYDTYNDIFDYTVFMDSVYNVTFKDISILRGNNSTNIVGSNSVDIQLINLQLNNNIRFSTDSILYITSVNGGDFLVNQSNYVDISHNNWINYLSIDGACNNIAITHDTVRRVVVNVSGENTNHIHVDSNVITNSDNEFALYFRTTNSTATDDHILGNDITGPGSLVAIENISSIERNKLSGATNDNAYGLIIHGSNQLIANNFITVGGLFTNSRAIYIDGSANKIVYNSINNVGNAQTSIGIETNGNLTDLFVKNNIFSASMGVPAIINQALNNTDWDYNCYYSNYGNIGKYMGVDYSDLTAWGPALGFDANSINFNPFYVSNTDLLPYQRQINGSGISIPNIYVDIENELRNQQAPDIGAQEFMVDFGITQLISPTNECTHTENENVTVMLKQFGDVPFTDIELIYTVNGGAEHYAIVNGTITNDIEFTFPTTENLSADGTYIFKIWLKGNLDDNVSNDTLVVIRKTKPSPIVSFNSDLFSCANVQVLFNATVEPFDGDVAYYQWNFGDNTDSTIVIPSIYHLFEYSDTFTVNLKVFTDYGCYAVTSDTIILINTPNTLFNVSDHCFGATMPLTNATSMNSLFNLSYFWDFGDGSTSIEENPLHVYSSAGDYSVALTVASDNGCQDTDSSTITVHALPELSTNLLPVYPANLSPVALIGTPYGGYFSGNGVVVNMLDASLTGIDTTSVTYTYTDPQTFCQNSIVQSVQFVDSIIILSQPSNTVVCPGTDVIFTVNVGGPDTLVYQWFKYGLALDGETSSSIHIVNASSADTGLYHLQITNPYQEVISIPFFVSVQFNHPQFNQLNAICLGEPLPVMPAVSLNSISGNWMIIDSNSNFAELHFYADSNQCALDTVMTIGINAPGTAPVFNQITAICEGESLVLPEVSTNFIVGNWNPPIDNTMTMTYTFTPDSNQCAIDTNMTIQVNQHETPVFDQIAALCSGTSNIPILPTISNNNIAGNWSPALVDNLISTSYSFTPSPGQCAYITTMTIAVNDATNSTTPLFNPFPAVCSGLGDLSGSLSTSSLNFITGSWSLILDNSTTQTYLFTADVNQCAADTQVVIGVIAPNSTPVFTQINPICQGEFLADLPYQSTNYIVGSWSPLINNNDTTTYTFTPDLNQCNAQTTTMTIAVNPTPEILYGASDLILCEGESLVLTSSIENGNSWSTGETTTSINVNAAGNYSLSNTSCAGLPITVIVNPTPLVDAGQDVSLCSGESVTLNAASNDPITWNNGISNGTSFVPQGTSYYVATATNSFGCTAFDNVTVSVTQPDSTFIAETAFNSYTWSTNNMTYTQSGNYTAVLQNQLGCDSVVTLNLTMNPLGIEELENVFTIYPNPTSDLMTIETHFLSEEITFTIYDINGRLIQSGKLNGVKTTLDISDLEKGSYFIQLGKNQYTSKLTKI
jgi:hypothetical protein